MLVNHHKATSEGAETNNHIDREEPGPAQGSCDTKKCASLWMGVHQTESTKDGGQKGGSEVGLASSIVKSLSIHFSVRIFLIVRLR